MFSKKTGQLVVFSIMAVALALPAAADTGPTAKAVPRSAPQTKHFIQLKPGMQRTAFVSKTGLTKKQFIASADLPSKKQRP